VDATHDSPEFERKERERTFHNDRFADGSDAWVPASYSLVEKSSAFFEQQIMSRSQGGIVLEYGCGPGTYSFDLAQQATRVVGVDISEVAIERARARAQRMQLTAKTEFHVMDAEALTFPDATFDLVCGRAILHHLDYRGLLHLVQHPKFPQSISLGIISKLFTVDLARVVKNVKTNPFVRKKAENEFMQRYRRLALGEKVSLLKLAPNALLMNLSDENQPQLLETMLNSPNCSEGVVLRFINRHGERSSLYVALDNSPWHMNPAVAAAVAHDPEAPIKIILKVIPYLGLAGLQEMFRDDSTHQIVRDRIREYLEQRHPLKGG